ncbi:putative esterase/lipase [Bradyrhizobium sp. STM 3843]|uniref:alpha/beta hydrolase n=1 Tax=Bradyrhizobium sp. STM 3843 TaxID=551947 RepID=UPI00024033B2|nr:alpha/beta hydrolase [Bradyrhizobium sp. STM 3843]CCE07685.1 putative esterase/lipase [Bradyrhizobium sp. STM 3843]
MARLRLAPMLAAAWLSMTAAQAQESPMPDDIAWKLIEIGRSVDPAKTAAIYAPLQQMEPYAGVRVQRDVRYGPAERNLLDVFAPEGGTGSRPILIFVHGGGFIGGNKRTPDSPFYDNIMLWAAKNGFLGVNITYRLAPKWPWPAGVEDVASAVQWVAANAAQNGGDPTRIFLMGHSAGAVHVAAYVAHPEFHKLKGGGLAGAIMLSGIYDLTGSPLGDQEMAYFGTDPARFQERSSLQGLQASTLPLMIASAELDPPRFVEQFDLLKQAACKRAIGCAHAVMLPQHSHMSEVYSINTDDDRLTREILAFVTTSK